MGGLNCGLWGLSAQLWNPGGKHLCCSSLSSLLPAAEFWVFSHCWQLKLVAGKKGQGGGSSGHVQIQDHNDDPRSASLVVWCMHGEKSSLCICQAAKGGVAAMPCCESSCQHSSACVVSYELTSTESAWSLWFQLQNLVLFSSPPHFSPFPFLKNLAAGERRGGEAAALIPWAP